jgi:hypothetical protein
MSTIAVTTEVVSVIEFTPETPTIIQSGLQGPPGPSAEQVSISDIAYDELSRVVAYTRAGVAYVVAYPNTNTITITGGGSVWTVTLDGEGRPTQVIQS